MTADAEFALDRELEACVITRELLRQIEQQLASLHRDVLGSESGALDLSVFDAFGVETFRTACDMPMSGFPDTTDCVRLVLEAKAGAEGSAGERSIKIKIAFRSEHGNRLLIRLRGPLARERAIGFYDRVQQLVEPHSLDSWLFRRRGWVEGPCAFVVVVGGLAWLANTYDQFTATKTTLSLGSYLILTAVIGTACAYTSILHFLYPRCAFETRRWNRRQTWRMWAAQGFATLIVFDTILTTVGKRLLVAIGVHGP
jgi:hypothetical protein